ncbi:MAG TPA: hypothetical protein VFR66_13705 [Burkholderiales bacterium]|nr:hypothetical protein [Burkholderiales bacterium]
MRAEIRGRRAGHADGAALVEANGPEPDYSRMLSGHPQDFSLPPAPGGEGTLGRFGRCDQHRLVRAVGRVSYTANLTPDKETGLGKWR